MDLRPYQTQLIKDVDHALEEHRAVCAVLPTGGGKTVCFSSMAKAITSQGASVWALAHREELVDQMSAKFLEFQVPHGLIKSGMSLSSSPIQVGMIQTTKNKMDRLKPPDVLVIDECHHTPASQYSYIVNAMPPETKIIGFTATPCRLDGKGLGSTYEALIPGPGIADLIAMGYLTPPKIFYPKLIETEGLHTKYGEFVQAEVRALFEEPAIIGDCFDHYMKLAPNTSAVSFCPSITIAMNFAAQFTANGVPSACIYGDLGRTKIADLLRRFRSREIMVLFSVALIDEGFDCPGIETVIDLAPTKSLSRYLQRIGRALRVQDGKKHAIILDHVGNRYQHGSPTEHREWSLLGKPKRSDDDEEIDLRTCSVCKLVYTGRMCPDCMVEEMRDTPDRTPIEIRKGELIEEQEQRNWLTKDELAKARECQNKDELAAFAEATGVPFNVVRDIIIRNAGNLEELMVAGRVLGYSPGWAQHRHIARHGKAPTTNLGVVS